MIKKIKDYINKSEFTKNSIIMIGGTTAAQLLPVAISPILTRLYSPEDFGVLALFMSLSMILSIVATGRYELAIILPRKDSYAINILALIVIIASVFSLLLMIAILLFHDFFISLLNNNGISSWLYLLPTVVFFISLLNALNYYHSRFKNYKLISIAKITRSTFLSVIQLGLFFFKNGVLALISGYSLAQLSGNIILLIKTLKNKELLRKIHKNKILALAKRYKKFPQFTMLASLFNKSSIELPNILLASLFDVGTLGFYSLSYRILSVPSAFIGMSISQVFMQETTKQKEETGKSIIIFDSVLKKLLFIGISFFGILFFTAEPIFDFVFGQEWRVAGIYAKILSPLLLFRFTASTLSSLLYVYEKHKIILAIQISLLVLTIITFIFSYYANLSIENFLKVFSLVFSIFYIIYLIILRLVANSKI